MSTGRVSWNSHDRKGVRIVFRINGRVFGKIDGGQGGDPLKSEPVIAGSDGIVAGVDDRVMVLGDAGDKLSHRRAATSSALTVSSSVGQVLSAFQTGDRDRIVGAVAPLQGAMMTQS